MTNYELKQDILDKMEIEGLVEKIEKLEKELAQKELELNKTTKEFISFPSLYRFYEY